MLGTLNHRLPRLSESSLDFEFMRGKYENTQNAS